MSRSPRLISDDPRYGPICPTCAGPKNREHASCWSCWHTERIREHYDGYWDRRTCACGAPKTASATRCKPCADEAKRGVPLASGRPQPQSHPWRKKVAA